MLNALANKFELSRGENGKNVRPMEGLRGFAVFLVFFAHYLALSHLCLLDMSCPNTLVQGFNNIGKSGVGLFFVLSGYLIYGSLVAKPQSFTRYFARRIQRIYPVFIVIFLIYIALSLLVPSMSKIPSSPISASVFLLENFLMLPGIFPIIAMISVAWSLSFEVFFYILSPVLITLFDLRSKTNHWRIGFFSILMAALVFTCLVWGGLTDYIFISMFLTGILLYELVNISRLKSPTALMTMLILAFGLFIQMFPAQDSIGHVVKALVLCVAFFVLCLGCFRVPTGLIGKIFSWTPLRWLGNMSYSYYLVHGLVLKTSFLVLFKLTGQAQMSNSLLVILFPAFFGMSLVASTVLFLLIERPFSLVKRSEVLRKSESVSV